MVPARAVGRGAAAVLHVPVVEVVDVHLGDSADEGVGLGRRAAANEHEAVPHDHGEEVITGARGVGEDDPRSGHRGRTRRTRASAAVVALVVAADEVDLAAVHDRTRCAAPPAGRDRAADGPAVRRGVEGPHVLHVGLVRIPAGERAGDVDRAVPWYARAGSDASRRAATEDPSRRDRPGRTPGSASDRGLRSGRSSRSPRPSPSRGAARGCWRRWRRRTPRGSGGAVRCGPTRRSGARPRRSREQHVRAGGPSWPLGVDGEGRAGLGEEQREEALIRVGPVGRAPRAHEVDARDGAAVGEAHAEGAAVGGCAAGRGGDRRARGGLAGRPSRTGGGENTRRRRGRPRRRPTRSRPGAGARSSDSRGRPPSRAERPAPRRGVEQLGGLQRRRVPCPPRARRAPVASVPSAGIVAS